MGLLGPKNLIMRLPESRAYQEPDGRIGYRLMFPWFNFLRLCLEYMLREIEGLSC